MFAVKTVNIKTIDTESPIDTFLRNASGTQSLNRSICFCRVVGIDGDDRAYIEKIKGIDIAAKNMSYIRLNRFDAPTPDALNMYSRMFDAWSKAKDALPEDVMAMPFPIDLQDRTLKWSAKNVFCQILQMYQKLTPQLTESMFKTFAIKMLFWIDKYLKPIFTGRVYPKIAVTGDVKKQESLFLLYCANIGCDVLYMHPSEDLPSQYPDLLVRSKLHIAGARRACSIPIPDFGERGAESGARPGPAGARSPMGAPQGAPSSAGNQPSVNTRHPARAPSATAPPPMGAPQSTPQSVGNQPSVNTRHPARAPSATTPQPMRMPPPPATAPQPMRMPPPPATAPQPMRMPPPPATAPPPMYVPPPASSPPPANSPQPLRIPPPTSVPPPVSSPPSAAAPQPLRIPPPMGAPPPPASQAGYERTFTAAPQASGVDSQREMSYEELAAFSTSVVMIGVFDSDGGCLKTGSGVVISERGFILTTFQVVSGGAYYAVHFENDNEDYYTDKLTECHTVHDLAIIRVDKRCRPIRILQQGRLSRGQKIVAIGSPLGLFNTFSDGIISGFRQIEDTNMIQFTAPISSGSSGGALMDMHGRLIGVITAGLDTGQNLNLAVDFNTIYNFAKPFV